MGALKNIVGEKFGRITVLRRIGSVNKKALWECECECGKIIESLTNPLASGHTKSCGCLRYERNISTPIVHGHTKRSNGRSSTYYTWQGMKTRCTNEKVKSFKDYGGRGITICEKWLTFEGFLEDMGERPKNTTIDRINNNKGYYKENCQWTTKIKQANNQSTNVKITINGETYGMCEWSRKLEISSSILSYRLKHGWKPEELHLSVKQRNVMRNEVEL